VLVGFHAVQLVEHEPRCVHVTAHRPLLALVDEDPRT
jgi:hypothetical protein